MQKIRIIAEVEIYGTQAGLPSIKKNAMRTLRKKFEDELGNLKAEPKVIADQSNGGIVTITLRGENE